jgi:hypothetical protein
MSLKLAAEHLKSKGRGPDTELVHMTKGEIKGLRQLAMAHGGDLTINPETGLVEAGFLSKILPIVAAGAATYFTAGAAAPLLEGALAETALAGYGGLMAGAGAGALIGGVSAGIQGGNVGRGALFGGLGGALSGGLGAYDAAPVAEALNPATGEELTKLTLNPDVNAGLAGTTQYVPTPPPTGVPTAAGIQAAGLPEGAARNAALEQLATGQGVHPEGFAGLPGQGPNLTAPQYSQAELAKYTKPASYYSGLGSGMGDMAKKAAILAAPGIGAQYGINNQDNTGQVPTGQQGTSTLSRISPNFRAQEPAQPNPYYAAQYEDYKKNPYMAGGGVVAFANRGIVQDLPRSSGADVGTYSDTDPNTNKLDAYNAALYRFNKANKKAGIKAPVQFKQAQALGDIEEAASGGIMRLAAGGMPGPVEQMSQNMLGGQGNMYPQSQQEHTNFATPTQMPASAEVIRSDYDAATNPYTGVMMAKGGITGLGGYSDGGRMLKGPGDGMSDSIPAVIGSKQPARLADGEFVVPADVVSHLGNGSTDAGAKKLYNMMDKIRKARTGKKKQAPKVKTDRFLPA